MYIEKEDYKNSKWIILGIKSYLGSVDKYKNYIYGPDNIRKGLNEIFYVTFNDIGNKDIYDYGDIEIKNDYINEIYENIKEKYDKNKKYAFIGGDHSITYPIIKFIKENFDDFYILYFDSHPDIQPDPDINNESFMFYLLRDEIIDKNKLIYFGISNFSKDEIEIIKYWNIKYFTPYDIKYNFDKILELKNEIKNKNVYISIDVDIFDSLCGHWKEPYTINISDYFRILNELKPNVISFDLVELDGNDFCNKFGAKLLLETISILNHNKT